MEVDAEESFAGLLSRPGLIREAYYIPETWSKIGKLFHDPFLYGRGLDSRAQSGRQRHHPLGVGSGESDDELRAAVARHEVARATDRLAQRPGDAPEALVAGLPSQSLVVVREMVDVDEDEGQRRQLAQGLSPFALEEFLELVARGDLRQAVERVQARQLGPRRLKLLAAIGEPGRQLPFAGPRPPGAGEIGTNHQDR